MLFRQCFADTWNMEHLIPILSKPPPTPLSLHPSLCSHPPVALSVSAFLRPCSVSQDHICILSIALWRRDMALKSYYSHTPSRW